MRIILAVLVSCVIASQDPQIFNLVPASGPIAGGTNVYVNGTNLHLVTHCAFATAAGRKIVEVAQQPRTGDHVVCISPNVSTPIPMTVHVSEDRGESWFPASGLVLFSYYNLPELAPFSPVAGPSTGSTHIHTRFPGFIEPSLRAPASCMFGTQPPTITKLEIAVCERSTSQEPMMCGRCETPQVCHTHDPVEKEGCREQTVPVWVSLNGQDFAQSGSHFTFQNNWAYP